MINFRFHIVSLTAVLLALGIGLVLGTTFLDDAVQQTLKSQLEGLQGSLNRARERNDDLEAQLNQYKDEASAMNSQLGERLYRGLLTGDPVLVVSTRGVQEELVDAKGVSRLYRTSVRTTDLLWMILAAVFTLAVALMLSEPVRLVLRAFWQSLFSG